MRSLESIVVSQKIKALQERLDDIENRLDTLYCYYCSSETSSDSDSTEPYYVTSDEPTSSEKKISRAKCVKIKSAQARNKKAKPRRNQRKRARTVNFIIESDKLTSNG
ncbi:unnamed protein product [Rhizophagus irregularis]|uniref:Uncharacterized protein n=1 Tax=Rhizophagus irregularis TaxID=588596 RepID=A0A2I1FX32_9GLOM|nr:hypothetical protein RhiirA4_519512 [Rhizophagus irregularis]CAB4411593.1 unnamed protein product [Rhizophagus irregularis]